MFYPFSFSSGVLQYNDCWVVSPGAKDLPTEKLGTYHKLYVLKKKTLLYKLYAVAVVRSLVLLRCS